MIRNNRVWAFLILVIGLGSLAGACARPAAPAGGSASEMVTVKIAVLPILDALPMYVAQQEGYFKAHNVRVEFIPAASAAERDQVIAAGQADGMINEIVSVLFYNRDKIQVQIVRFARVAGPDAPMFRILASAQSGITSVEGLKNTPIGISQGTVIEYLTDRLLQQEGLQAGEIQSVAVPKIPDRMALLGTGELKAAMLPDPTSSLAIQQGARMILDDTRHPEFSHSTYAFRKAFIDQHPQAVQGFLAAIETAVQAINADPTRWNALLGEQKLVPTPLLNAFSVPKFVAASVPDEKQWKDVLAWTKEKGLLQKDVSFQDSITARYLPK